MIKPFLRPAIMVLLIMALFGMFVPSAANTTPEVNSIIQKVLNHKDTQISVNPLNSALKVAILAFKENKAEHSNFDWRWDIHIIRIEYRDMDKKVITVEMIRKEYKKNVTPGRSFVIQVVLDILADGYADNYFKEFKTTDGNNVIIEPVYPDRFVNKDWYEGDRQEFYEEELNYWHNKLK